MNIFLKHWDYEAAIAIGIKPTFVQKLIYLRSRLIHTEVVFSERYGGISFSFTMADGVNGGRFKMIPYSTPEIWVTDEIPMTDAEEDLALWLACQMADRKDMVGIAAWDSPWFPPDAIYQGKKHWGYDLIGLLTFANDTAYGHKNNKLFNLFRPLVAGPLGLLEDTGILHPDPKKAWCSEGSCLVVHHGKGIDKQKVHTRPDKLHPSGLHDYVNKSGLALKRVG